ncbi:MAG: 30S ribosomal protein S20 [Candidatus Marinimicrobia bacterium]|nr:30S ribosomal protein S20 [Candidatus Neomarinimicrobiota bacterium]
MAHPLSTKKRIRQANKARLKNNMNENRMKTLVKNVSKAENKSEAESNLLKAISFVDKMAQKHVIHKNKASHIKSRMQKVVNEMK